MRCAGSGQRSYLLTPETNKRAAEGVAGAGADARAGAALPDWGVAAVTAVGVGVGAGDEAAAGVAFHAAFQIVIGNGRGIQQQQQKRQQQQQRRHRQQKHHQQHHRPSVAPVRPSTARDSSLDRPPGPAPLDCLIYARVIVGLNVSQSVQVEGHPAPRSPGPGNEPSRLAGNVYDTTAKCEAVC